ncbi:MAG: stage III sporulation protein AG [Bacillota bacterium]|nr:stage III sporulation protein AG [Bacillota bacterium]
MSGTTTPGLEDWRAKVRQVGKSAWLLLLGLLGVLLLALGNFPSTPASAPASPQTAAGGAAPVVPPAQAAASDEYTARLEEALAGTLSQVAGAGRVSVRVFLASGPRYEYARKTTGETRTTQESDRDGTSRVTSEQHEEGEVTVIRGEPGGKDVPVVVVTRLPEIQGVLVAASGAVDPVVRAELAKAVETALNLPPHRVRVLAKEGE